MNYFINALAIRRWAERVDARSTLPQVIRRLATATVKSITEIAFPAHESVQRSGFDGVIVCNDGNAWVPSGRSVWELTVKGRIKSKADDDFAKRTAETLKEVQERSVFILATPRHWQNKDDWVAERAEDGDWKEVRAYDCDDLEQWFEACASVAIWFGGQIGVRPPGVDDLFSRWKAISQLASRELLPAIFLTGRQQTVERLREWLAGPPKWLAISCRSPVEVVDFLSAWSASLDDSDRAALESRAILVEDFASWRQLRDGQTPAVLIIDPSILLTPEDIARAIAKGHHVLLAVEPTSDASNRTIELERAGEFELTQALEKCGYSPAEAWQLARASGGSLAVLKNRLAQPRPSTIPSWAIGVPHDIITACLLLGGWSETNPEDRTAFAKLSRCAYDNCESHLQKLSTSRDPLLLHAAHNWRLISKDEAWTIFGNQVPPSALHDFESLAVEILADDDPRFSLPENERRYAAIQGHVPKYSATIKKHVAESLALLGTIGGSIEASVSMNISASMHRIVAGLLPPSATWHRWASLGPRLALLAEASPNTFLQAVRSDLARSDPELSQLFAPDGGGIFGSCNHAGLLWALECLAWSKLYLGEAAEFLLTLADRDPGGQWSNRPANSLLEILSSWIPHTTATCDERVKVLDLLIQRSHKAAWPILLNLLPSPATSHSIPTHKPYWRDWANSWSRGAAYGERYQFLAATGERVIRQAGIDVGRWKQVFHNIVSFVDQVRPKLLEAARLLSTKDLTENQRRVLAEELSEQIHTHRRFYDSHWALPPTVLDQFESVLEGLQPQSDVMKNVWLFKKWPEQFLDREGSHEHNQKALAEARTQAITDIIASQGFSGIEDLLAHSESPYDVGYYVSLATQDAFLSMIIPTMLDGEHAQREFSAGFIWNRWYAAQWPWVDNALLLCSTPGSAACLLSSLPFTRQVWQRADSAGEDVRALYWNRRAPFNPELESQDVEAAVSSLVKYGRPVPAIDLLSSAVFNKRAVSTECLFSPLEALRSLGADDSRKEFGQAVVHGVPRILAELQERNDADEARLLAIEFAFLRLLNEHTGHEPRALFNHLAAHPTFFVEMVSYCYRSKNEEVEQQAERVKRDPNVAMQIYQLLHDWRRIPGTNAEGVIDETALRAWCSEARRLADEVGQLEMCDNYIGQLLAHAPAAGDATWPCKPVRQIATEIGTESLASGLCCGICNSRGFVWRGSGGNQERELATEYRSHADAIRFEHPFVAKILDDVARQYEGEAKHWDELERWEE